MNNHLPPPQLDRPKSTAEDEKTETRLTRVETIVEYLSKAIDRLESSIQSLRSDHRADISELRQELNEFRKEVATHMRWLLGIVFASFMSLLAMMAKINHLL